MAIQVKQNQILLWTWVAGAHLKCEKNHYVKFEHKGIKSVLNYLFHKNKQCKHSKGVVDLITSKFYIPKNIIKVHKI